MHVQVVVLLIKPIDFLDVFAAVASLNLYVPNNQNMRERCWLRQRGQLKSTLLGGGGEGDLSTLDRFSPHNGALETQC